MKYIAVENKIKKVQPIKISYFPLQPHFWVLSFIFMKIFSLAYCIMLCTALWNSMEKWNKIN